MRTERENFRDVHLPEYNEEAAVIALNNSIYEAVDYQNSLLEGGTDPYDQITIVVNGVQHGFLLGGPQVQALYCFLANICEENGYDMPFVDKDNEKWYLKDGNDSLYEECCKLHDKLKAVKNFYAHYASPYDYTLDVAERGMLWGMFLKEEHPEKVGWKMCNTILQLPPKVQVELKDYIHEYLVDQLGYSYDDFLDGTYRQKCIDSFAEDELWRAETLEDEEELECMDLEDQLDYLLK